MLSWKTNLAIRLEEQLGPETKGYHQVEGVVVLIAVEIVRWWALPCTSASAGDLHSRADDVGERMSVR